MDLNKLRKEFTIYIADDEESIREVCAEAIGSAGYQVKTFADGEACFNGVKEAPPHLILSDIRMPGMNGIELLEKVRELSDDIAFIIMTSHASLETAVNAMKLGAYDYIYKPFENIQDVVSTVDRTITHVFVKLENQQLLEELHEKNKLLENVNQKIAEENREIQFINQLMQKLTQTLEPDAVVQAFLDSVAEICEGKPALFLKHLPQHQSVLVSQAAKVPKDQLKGLGISLKGVPPETAAKYMADPKSFSQLKDFAKEVFGATSPLSFPFLYQNHPLGIVMMLFPPASEQAQKLIESCMQITRVSFDSAMMARRIHEMAIKDPLTGLYNRRYFNEKLEEEMSRCRRTHYPLSLIYMDIDHFKKYNDQNGHPEGDALLKQVAVLLQKSSRKGDIVARLGGEEFAIICPATPLDGGAIKAEKVRATIEATKFAHGEKQPMGKVTISLGVSEYPSTVNDAATLVSAADDALYQVKQGGRNRVCMAAPPEGFKPDFEALKVPTPGDAKKSEAS